MRRPWLFTHALMQIWAWEDIGHIPALNCAKYAYSMLANFYGMPHYREYE